MATLDVYELPQLGLRAFSAPSAQNVTELTYLGHKHPYYEMHIIEEGSLILEIGQVQHRLQQGQFCLIAPGTEHVPHSDLQGVVRYFVSYELMASAPLRNCLERHMAGRTVYVGSAQPLMEIVGKLRTEQAQKRSFRKESVQLLLSQLLVETARTLESTVQNQEHTSLDQSRNMLIDTFLNNNFHLSAGENLLAQELGMSCRQLDRVLKKQYGKGYRELIRDVRKDAAASLLKHSDKSVRWIGEQVGYSTTSNFISFFKSVFGMTPLEYRKLFTEK